MIPPWAPSHAAYLNLEFASGEAGRRDNFNAAYGPASPSPAGSPGGAGGGGVRMGGGGTPPVV